MIVGSAALLFVAQAAMSPAEPAPASSLVRGETNAVVAAPPSAPQPAAAALTPAASPDPNAAAFTLAGVFTETGGLGSAIIAFGDDRQRGFGVGGEIVPGVVLTGVQAEGVTVSYQGASYSILLGKRLDPLQPVGAPDISGEHRKLAQAPLPLAVPATAPISGPGTSGQGASGPSAKAWRSALNDINFAPVRNGKDITGALVQPTSSESAQIVGLLAGDVIFQVRGKRIGSADAVAGIGRELTSRRDVVVQVQRGQRVKALYLRGAGDASE
jgi:type II secretory pathway component PulC